jgi:hypothetical protein
MIRVQKAKTLSASCPPLRTAGHQTTIVVATSIPGSAFNPLVRLGTKKLGKLTLKHALQGSLKQFTQEIRIVCQRLLQASGDWRTLGT